MAVNTGRYTGVDHKYTVEPAAAPPLSQTHASFMQVRSSQEGGRERNP
jgi:hypothetical protein